MMLRKISTKQNPTFGTNGSTLPVPGYPGLIVVRMLARSSSPPNISRLQPQVCYCLERKGQMVPSLAYTYTQHTLWQASVVFLGDLFAIGRFLKYRRIVVYIAYVDQNGGVVLLNIIRCRQP